MIQDLIELLDRSWAALDAEKGLDFALQCFPFHEQLLRDSRLNALLIEFRREEADSIAVLRRVEVTTRARLATIADALEAGAPPALEAASDDAPDDVADCVSSIGLVRQLLSPAQANEHGERDGRDAYFDDRVNRAIGCLKELVSPARTDKTRVQLDEVERAFGHAARVRATFVRTSAASALTRLEQDFADLHPPEIDPGRHAKLARLARVVKRPLGAIYDKLFGGGLLITGFTLTTRADSDMVDSEDDAALAQYLERMRRDMRRVYEEIRRRLGAERSLIAVFDRYRHRCQWYEADRLRDVAAHGRGKPEDRLTATLAAYLFDHGLNPLTRPLAGQLQPDLLGTGTRFSFYVEAKQYRRANRAYLVKGMQQVWDMLHQIRGTPVDVAEAFYIVYRRGGPRYAFSVDRVQHGDRVVHVMLIDIAPADQRGSRAPQTVSIEQDELLPRQSKPSSGSGVRRVRGGTPAPRSGRRRGTPGARVSRRKRRRW
jgi:hypothetical protein